MQARSAAALVLVCTAAAACHREAPAVSRDQATEVRQFRRDLHRYFDAFAARNRDSLRALTTSDFVLLENGYSVDFDQLTDSWSASEPRKERYAFDSLQVTIVDTVALFRYGLGWYHGDRRIFWGLETGIARRVGDGWKFAMFHGSWLPSRIDVAPDTLREYTGRYGNEKMGRLVVSVQNGRLYIERADHAAWVAGVGRVQLIPAFRDRFTLEFANVPIQFIRGAGRRVTAMLFPGTRGGMARLDRESP